MATWDHDDLRDTSGDCPECRGTGQPRGVMGGPELGLCGTCGGTGRISLIHMRPTRGRVEKIKGEVSMPKFPSDGVTDRSLMSGRVRRYHTWPVIKEQTIGDHCWGVYHVYWRIFGGVPGNVAFYIHVHDADELVIGDNPFPMSARYPSLGAVKKEMGADAMVQLDIPEPSLSEEERKRVKICDLLEMMQFGMQEREMGNLLAQPIIERTRAATQERAMALAHVDRMAVHDWIMKEVARHERVLGKSGSTL